MLKYIDEIYYLTNYSSNMPKDFNRLNIEASIYIKKRTSNKIDINNIPEEVKYATCEIVNLTNEQERLMFEIGNLKSQNRDGISETYMTPDDIKNDYEDKKLAVLSNYLSNVIGKDGKPLLYLGAC